MIYCLSFFLWFITNICLNASREYYIKEGENPSYMYRKFENVLEKIFPKEIRIEVSLSSITGTLLYSIDKNMNQFIVTLRDDMQRYGRFGIVVELNGNRYYESLANLCKCNGCKFDIPAYINLRIAVDNFIYFQCNGREISKHEIKKGKELHQNYPILPFSSDSKSKSVNEAHLWIVNTPPYGGVYPNQEQMFGCIYKVVYNDAVVTFTNVSSNVESYCKVACSNEMCNGGECQYFFSSKPICNCTIAFLNGQFCSDNIYPMNLHATSQGIVFRMIKLSWKSRVNEILELNNKNIRIRLGINKTNIYFEYQFGLNHNQTKQVILSKAYIPDTESILISYFQNDLIDIRLYNNKVWKSIQIPFHTDLRNERFDNVTLRSGEGTMDFYHKNSMENVWEKVELQNAKVLEKEMMSTTSAKKTDQEIIVGASIGGPLLFVVILIAIIFLYKGWLEPLQMRRKKRKDRKFIDNSKDFLGWNIILGDPNASKDQWITFIHEKIQETVWSDSQEARMYDNMTVLTYETDNAVYDIILLLYHLQIFILPKMSALTRDYSTSSAILIKLLQKKDKTYHKYLHECIIDFLDDISNYYVDNANMEPLVLALLQFVAYHTVINDYRYNRDHDFPSSYLRGNDQVSILAAIIMCHIKDRYKPLWLLHIYLENKCKMKRKVCEEEILAYLTIKRIIKNNDMKVHLTCIDYRIITEIDDFDCLTKWTIRYVKDNIIETFLQLYKDDILRIDDAASLSENQSLSIKCLSVCLEIQSFDDKINKALLKLLEDVQNNESTVANQLKNKINEYYHKFGKFQNIEIQRNIQLLQDKKYRPSYSNLMLRRIRKRRSHSSNILIPLNQFNSDTQV